MPQRPVGVTDLAPAADVAEYRVRERSVGGSTVAEQYLILRRERVLSFLGMAATFRTVGSATQVGTIMNLAGSSVLVAVLAMESTRNASLGSTSLVMHRGVRISAVSGGTVLDKVSVGTGADLAETSSSSVEVRSLAPSDSGGGTAFTTLTETSRLNHIFPVRLTGSNNEFSPSNRNLPIGELEWGPFGFDTLEFPDGADPTPLAILRPGEGLGVVCDGTSSGASSLVNFLWEEYTLP